MSSFKVQQLEHQLNKIRSKYNIIFDALENAKEITEYFRVNDNDLHSKAFVIFEALNYEYNQLSELIYSKQSQIDELNKPINYF